MEWVVSVVNAVIVGAITGAAAFAAIRVELRWLRADIDALKRDLDTAHGRIDKLVKGAI